MTCSLVVLDMSTGPLPASLDGRPRPLLRQGVPGEKKPLLEKILTYYDQLFQVHHQYVHIIITILYRDYIQGDDPSVSIPQFWEEFFLLKVRPHTHYTSHTQTHVQVNVEYLSKRLDGLEAQQLLALKVRPHNTVPATL